MCSGYSRNLVAGVAAVLANVGSSHPGIAAASERRGALHFCVSQAITAGEQHDENRDQKQPCSHLIPPSDKRPSSAMRVYCHRVCDSFIHLTSKTKATISSNVPAGIHIINPPSC